MKRLKISNYPSLTTERLHLRQVTMKDAPSFFELRSNERVMQHINRPQAKRIEDARATIQQILDLIQAVDAVHWGITLKGSDKVIGAIGYWKFQKENYRSEIGYMLHPDLFGKGLMTEALKVALRYGFKEIGLHSVCAEISPANEKSIRVVERQGFVKEAHFRECYYYNGAFVDTCFWGLLKSDWEKQ